MRLASIRCVFALSDAHVMGMEGSESHLNSETRRQPESNLEWCNWCYNWHEHLLFVMCENLLWKNDVKFGSAIYMYCSHDHEVDLLLLA